MSLSEEDQRRLREYLLGNMAGAAREDIERRFILNDSFFDEVRTLEDGLIGDYLAERLSGEQRRLFETNFLASARRKRKVEVQRGMRDFLSAAQEKTPALPSAAQRPPASPVISPRRFPAWLAIAAAWIVTAALAVYSTALHRRIAELRERLARIESASPVEPAAAQLVSALTMPGIERGAGPPATIEPSGASLIRLQLSLGGARSYESYRAGIETADGTLLLKQFHLKAEGKSGTESVTLTIPAALLPRGDYVATLEGEDGSGKPNLQPSYSFRVR